MPASGLGKLVGVMGLNGADELFQLLRIRHKGTNALGQFFGRHGVLIQRQAEAGFVIVFTL